MAKRYSLVSVLFLAVGCAAPLDIEGTVMMALTGERDGIAEWHLVCGTDPDDVDATLVDDFDVVAEDLEFVALDLRSYPEHIAYCESRVVRTDGTRSTLRKSIDGKSEEAIFEHVFTERRSVEEGDRGLVSLQTRFRDAGITYAFTLGAIGENTFRSCIWLQVEGASVISAAEIVGGGRDFSSDVSEHRYCATLMSGEGAAVEFLAVHHQEDGESEYRFTIPFAYEPNAGPVPFPEPAPQ